MNEVLLELCRESVRRRQVAVRKSRDIQREGEIMSTAVKGTKALDFSVEKSKSLHLAETREDVKEHSKN